ncbi:MAG TPA: sugar phosphate nucleotidyltransferase [Thermoanaerobaculia bacterium]|jgi:dTDP-glucose pyrophosphorylase
MWGIVPAAGIGSRIQPLAFSKELLPVGSRFDGEAERPRAVTEYLLDRMLAGGATRICFVISPGKSDIVSYFGGALGHASICYAVQQQPNGLCDALFHALPFIPPDEFVLVGLPDTVWFPENGFDALGDDDLSFLCFPVERPEFFDAVVMDEHDNVLEVQVKTPGATSNWIWGAFKLRARVLAELRDLWLERGATEHYIGTLVNRWIARGGRARAVCAGTAYVDVGTLHGYREAITLLADETAPGAAPHAAAR